MDAEFKMENKQHWETVYQTKAANSVSWFQDHAETSLKLIDSTSIKFEALIIDVGGGASTLIDDLLNNGYSNLTVLDLSSEALNTAKVRLGDKAFKVNWVEGDITQASLPDHYYEIWHDRAVFHFLISAKDRKAYINRIKQSLSPMGYVIIATFAEGGPLRCSGLAVQQYSVETLQKELGDSFELLTHTKETHVTPSSTQQKFIYCLFRLK